MPRQCHDSSLVINAIWLSVSKDNWTCIRKGTRAKWYIFAQFVARILPGPVYIGFTTRETTRNSLQVHPQSLIQPGRNYNRNYLLNSHGYHVHQLLRSNTNSFQYYRLRYIQSNIRDDYSTYKPHPPMFCPPTKLTWSYGLVFWYRMWKWRWYAPTK